MTARLFAILLAAGLVACVGRDARPPAGEARSSRPPADPAAASPDPNDPGERGIPDLARLARYVFRTMQQRAAGCPLENPFRDTLHFAFELDVAAGRIRRVGLAEVALEGALGKLALLRRQWPPELVAYVGCLEPHLTAVVMDPAPADGSYQPFYSFKGRPDGKPLP